MKANELRKGLTSDTRILSLVINRKRERPIIEQND